MTERYDQAAEALGAASPAPTESAPPDLRWLAAVENMPAIVYTEVEDPTSPTGFREIYVSPQTTWLTGYTPEEWQADPELWYKTAHPADRSYLRDIDQDSAAFV